MVFWMYKRGNEWWITPEKYLEYKAKNAARAKRRRSNNPERAREISRQSHARNKEKERAYYEANKDVLNARWREYYAKNKDWLQPRKKQWGIDNRAKRRPVVNAYARKRRKLDPLVNMQDRIRSRFASAFSAKGYGKNRLSMEILGCSWEFFMQHIESQFTDGMNWGNRGKWHIDHIIPVDCAKDEAEIVMLNHYSNLRPLWGVDNWKKHSKIPENFLALWNQLCKVTGNECKIRM